MNPKPLPTLAPDGTRRECLIRFFDGSVGIARFNNDLNVWYPLYGLPTPTVAQNKVVSWRYVDDVLPPA